MKIVFLGWQRIQLLASMSALVITASAADYISPGLGSHIRDPRDLQLQNIQVQSESVLTNNRVVLEVTAALQNSDVGIWTGVFATLNDLISTNDYRYLSSSLNWDQFVDVGALATNENYISLIVESAELDAARAELLAGTVLSATAETVSGRVVDAATNLPLENIQIVAEHSLAGGRVLLQVGTAVRNQADEMLQEVRVHFLNTETLLNYIVPPAGIPFPNFAANETMSASGSMYLDVSSGALAAVRSNLLSGAALELNGTELWVFNAPPRAIDDATETAWRSPAESTGDEVRLVFTNKTDLLLSLAPGDLLLENPTVNIMLHEYLDNPQDPFDDDRKVLFNYVPFLVGSVSVMTNNEVHVVGQTKLLAHILKSGTFVAYASDAYDRPVRDPYNPTLENTYTQEEQEDREAVAALIRRNDPRDGRLADLDGLNALPFHFNLTNILDRVKFSGELFFRQSGLKFEVKIRDFQLERAVTRIDAGAVLNMLIEVEGKKPEGEGEQEDTQNLLPINPLPSIPFAIGGVPFTIQPELTLTAGVDENVPQSISLPLQSSFLIGMEMGFDRSRKTGTNDGFFYEPFVDAHPIRVSDPTVFDDLQLSLDAWVELGVGLKIGAGDGAVLRAGPSLAVRLNNNFTLAPLANPWWQIDSDIDLIGRFTMDASILGFESVDLVDLDSTLLHFDLFHRDAGGPLIQGMNAASANASEGTRPIVGENVRWARMFEPSDRFNLHKAFAFTLPGAENEIIVGGSGGVSGANSVLAKFAADGELLWMKDTFPLGGPLLEKGAPLPNGSFFTAGQRFHDTIASLFDRDGNPIWMVAYTPNPSFTVRDVAATTNRTGQAEFYITGYMNHGIVTRSDPILVKLDPSGAVSWAFYYDLHPGDDEVYGMTISSDGNPILCGATDVDVSPPSHGTPAPGTELDQSPSCGLLMKVDADSGSIIWAQTYASTWGMLLQEVIEAPDGTIFAGGGAGKIVTQTRPANLIGKFAHDGSLLSHVTIGDDPDWVDELPNGGSSPYDTITDLIWTLDGLFACGNTGLGLGTAAWVMGLTEELGVKFFTVFDGDMSEAMIETTDAGDGLAVLGNFQSVNPIGQGGKTIGVLMKLPWEGILRFHEDTGMRSLYLQPRVFNSGGTEEFQVISTTPVPGAAPMRFGNSFSSFTATNAPITMTPGEPVQPLKPTANPMVAPLERLDSTMVHDFQTWATYHRLPPESGPETDTDGDGTADLLESYFGSNPWVPDAGASLTISLVTNDQQSAVIEFERNTFARTFPVHFESAGDLLDWSLTTDVTEQVEPLGSDRERVWITVPVDSQLRFFRVMADTNLP